MSDHAQITPALPPPSGVHSNFVDPENCKRPYIIATCVFLPLAVIATALRVWTRAVVARSFAVDDVLMISATVLSISLTALGCVMLQNGLGVHMWDVPFTTVSPTFNKFNVSSIVVYCSATGLAKISILAFFLRVFPVPTFRFWTYVLIVITAGYEVASVFATLFNCHPVARSWDLTIEGHCLNWNAFYFTSVGLEVFTDLGTIAIIIPVLRPLQMPKRQKIAVGFLLATGCFALIISCVRLSSLLALQRSPDLTWNTSSALMWCCIELNTCIAGGCLTALRPFVRKYAPFLLSLSLGSYNSGSDGQPFDIETPLTLAALDKSKKSSQRDRTGPHLQVSYMSKIDKSESTEDMLRCVQQEVGSSGAGQAGIVRTVEYQVKS